MVTKHGPLHRSIVVQYAIRYSVDAVKILAVSIIHQTNCIAIESAHHHYGIPSSTGPT